MLRNRATYAPLKYLLLRSRSLSICLLCPHCKCQYVTPDSPQVKYQIAAGSAIFVSARVTFRRRQNLFFGSGGARATFDCVFFKGQTVQCHCSVGWHVGSVHTAAGPDLILCTDFTSPPGGYSSIEKPLNFMNPRWETLKNNAQSKDVPVQTWTSER